MTLIGIVSASAASSRSRWDDVVARTASAQIPGERAHEGPRARDVQGSRIHGVDRRGRLSLNARSTSACTSPSVTDGSGSFIPANRRTDARRVVALTAATRGVREAGAARLARRRAVLRRRRPPPAVDSPRHRARTSARPLDRLLLGGDGAKLRA